MAQTQVPEQETWESQTKASVFVYKKDRRTGDWKTTRVGGPNGPKRIRLSVDEREYNQEMIPDENVHLDPFKSGRLLRIDGDSGGVITNEDLHALLVTDSQEEFVVTIAEIDDELTLRRLLALAAEAGRMWQVEMVRDEVDDRYGVSKSQKMVIEMMQSPDGSLDETVSS